MSLKVKQVIEDVKDLTSYEKALIAHCLISSLETKQDEDADQLWVDLAEKRYEELISGKVKPLSWESIKKKVKG